MISLNLKGSLAACALFALAGCGPTEDEVRIGEEASAIHATLAQMSTDLAGVKADLTGFLVSDARAIKSCQVTQESALIERTFATLEQELNTHLTASESLAETYQPASPYATADAELAAHRDLIAKAERSKAGAQQLSQLLHESVTGRDVFKARADRAISRVFESSRSVVPLYNAQRTIPDRAEQATTRMKALNDQVAEAVRLKNGIAAAYDGAQRGELYNCSAWAVDVLRLERIAGVVDADVAALKRDWKSAE